MRCIAYASTYYSTTVRTTHRQYVQYTGCMLRRQLEYPVSGAYHLYIHNLELILCLYIDIDHATTADAEIIMGSPLKLEPADSIAAKHRIRCTL